MLKPRQGRREGTRCRSDLIPQTEIGSRGFNILYHSVNRTSRSRSLPISPPVFLMPVLTVSPLELYCWGANSGRSSGISCSYQRHSFLTPRIDHRNPKPPGRAPWRAACGETSGNAGEMGIDIWALAGCPGSNPGIVTGVCTGLCPDLRSAAHTWPGSC